MNKDQISMVTRLAKNGISDDAINALFTLSNEYNIDVGTLHSVIMNYLEPEETQISIVDIIGSNDLETVFLCLQEGYPCRYISEKKMIDIHYIRDVKCGINPESVSEEDFISLQMKYPFHKSQIKPVKRHTKYTESDVRKICELSEQGKCGYKIAEELGISTVAISRILSGRLYPEIFYDYLIKPNRIVDWEGILYSL